MKKLVQVQEIEGEGLISLLGEKVMVFCMNYIYSGKLVGVNERDILLEGAQLVYETGPLVGSGFRDSEALPSALYIRTSAIESYCKSGR